MTILKVVKSSRFIVAAMALVVGSASATMVPQQSNSDIKERIAPVAQVRIAGASSAPAAGAAGPRAGDAVYNQYCTACHTGGVLGAPKLNNAEDWKPRLAQGMETVLKHAMEGLNAMPPKGTCGDCSEEEIQAAIDYMIAEI